MVSSLGHHWESRFRVGPTATNSPNVAFHDPYSERTWHDAAEASLSPSSATDRVSAYLWRFPFLRPEQGVTKVSSFFPVPSIFPKDELGPQERERARGRERDKKQSCLLSCRAPSLFWVRSVTPFHPGAMRQRPFKRRVKTQKRNHP